METVWDSKVRGFIESVAATKGQLGLEGAIAQARHLGGETYDTAEIEEGERQARAIFSK